MGSRRSTPRPVSAAYRVRTPGADAIVVMSYGDIDMEHRVTLVEPIPRTMGRWRVRRRDGAVVAVATRNLMEPRIAEARVARQEERIVACLPYVVKASGRARVHAHVLEGEPTSTRDIVHHGRKARGTSVCGQANADSVYADGGVRLVECRSCLLALGLDAPPRRRTPAQGGGE